MLIQVDRTSSAQPWQQIYDQFLAHINSGQAAPGTRLPTVRQLAADLGVATETVAKVFRKLEKQGVIDTRGSRGSFVQKRGLKLAKAERRKRIGDKAAELFLTAAAVGASKEELQSIISDELDKSILGS